MTYYPLPSLNSSSYTNPNLNVGNLLKEDGDELLLESGDSILLENPSVNPNLTALNPSSYTLPSLS
jgi:hypothetical protein